MSGLIVRARRFAVFDVLNNRCGDTAYFSALHNELYVYGGASAFVHDMLAMSLDGWHPRFDIPQTAGLREQQIESAAPEIHWLWSLLEDGDLPDLSGNSVKAATLLDMAKSSHVGMKYFTGVKLARLVEKVGAVKKHKSNGNYWVFPPLAEARKKFSEAFPGFEPFSEIDGPVQWLNTPED